MANPLNFVGRVWKEGEETRGKLTVLSEENSGPEQVFYFKSFEDLKVILEERFKK